ncbi:MAG: ABC transporter substrate-binding protein, partial [Advenella sp.]
MNLKKHVFGIGLCAIALAGPTSAVAADKTIRFGTD